MQLRERRLSRAVFADQRDALAGANAEAQVAHGPALAARIAESDVLEHESLADRSRHRPRAGRRRDRRAHVEEREQVLDVQTLLVDPARRHQQTLNEVAALAERRGEERQRAERDAAGDRAHEHDDVRAVVAQRPDQRQPGADERLLDRERAVLGVEPVGERAIALDQPRREAEELDFLGRPVARADVAHVVELAPLRRPSKQQRVRQAGEVRLADEARQHRDDEQHDAATAPAWRAPR